MEFPDTYPGVILVLTTVPNVEAGEKLAAAIVEAKLAACVQILPAMTSVYLWKDEVKKDVEHLVLIKSFAEKFEKLDAFISANHTYEIPEVIAIDAARLSGPYLSWMSEVLK